jgi:uncharacterized Zn finger protein
MSLSRATTVPPTADVTIEYCPICYPQRPMVIKTVETTLRARPERFIFECPACGAVKQVPAPLLREPSIMMLAHPGWPCIKAQN